MDPGDGLGTDKRCLISRFNLEGELDWVIASESVGTARIIQIIPIPTGGLFVVGIFSSDLTLKRYVPTGSGDGSTTAVTLATLPNQGSTDSYIARIDDTGALTWIRHLGNTQSDRFSYGTEGSIFKNGALIVTGTILGPSSYRDAEGNVLQSIAYNNTAGTHWAALIMKINPSNGNVLWTRTLAGAGQNYAWKADVDSSGNVFVAGQAPVTTVLKDESGTAFENFDSISAANNTLAYLLKFNENGAPQWIVKGGSYIGQVVVDSTGSSYFYFRNHSGSALHFRDKTGAATALNPHAAYIGSFDNYVVRLNSDGVRQWARGITSPGDASMIGAMIGHDDAFIMGATHAGTLYVHDVGQNSSLLSFDRLASATNYDRTLVAFSKEGAVVWALNARAATGLSSSARPLAMDGSKNLYLGYSQASGIELRNAEGTSLGSYSNTGSAGNDLFMAKVSSAGALTWSKVSSDAGTLAGNEQVVGVSSTTSGLPALLAYTTGEDSFTFNGASVPTTSTGSWIVIAMPADQ